MSTNQQLAKQWILRLLSWFCPEHLYEEIEGDLMQKFNKDFDRFGKSKANRRLLWNVIRFFRPGIILRNKFSFELNQGYMIGNYFKMAFRNMMRNKIFSLIDIFGLSIGLLAFLLIIQYVSFEMSFDQFHSNKNEVYRISYSQYENNELKNTSAKNYIGLRSLIKENFPDIKSATGFWPVPANIGFTFGYQDKIYLENGKFLMSDRNFFSVFPDLLAKGDSSTVLADAHNLVISERVARKIFGDTDPINQHLVDISDYENDGSDYVITGILKDIPENAHFHADFIGAMGNEWDTLKYYWDTPSFHTYINVEKGSDVKQLEGRLNTVLDKIEPGHISMKGTQVDLQSLTNIHLTSHLQDELESNGEKSLLYILLSIALVILIIAWINYVNLETAQFVTKAREIGVRRIIGSTKWDLALQFLIKYFCVTLFAIILAFVSFKLVTPFFSYLTGIAITDIQWLQSDVLLSALGFFVVGSFLVGIYPAFVLVRLNPVSIIKGDFNGRANSNFFRKSLVVIQFTSSLVLLAYLFVVNEQLDFMRLTNKKIELSKVVSVKNALAYSDDALENKQKDFRNLQTKLLQNAGITQVCSSSCIPGEEIGFTLVNEIKRNQGDAYSPVRHKLLFIDDSFIPLFNLKVKAGRNYSQRNGEEENHGRIIVNESLINSLGFTSADEAIGQNIYFPLWNEKEPLYQIIGVVEDYHQESIKKKVLPTVYFLNQNGFQQVYYSMKLSEGSNPQESIAMIEKAWKEIFPDRPFEYFFLEDHYDRQFKSEVRFGRIFGIFAGVAVFLSCLGILGMTIFEANSRVKELSIRKVVGASMVNILSLLAKGNIKVVLISFMLATPLIYFTTMKWLEDYPSRIELTISFFVLPVIVMIIFVMLTSIFQIFKAANSNPINHLKSE